MTDTLTEGQKLEKGGSLTSPNGAHTLILQDDGNLVLYARDQAGVAHRHQGQEGRQAGAAGDRNLVLYAGNGPAWSSKTDTQEPPPPPPPPEPARTYTVVSGDTLWAISERFYGDGNQYQRIAGASGVD